MSYSFTLHCPKHLRQEPIALNEVYLPSGDKRYGAWCPVCGKKGPLRATMHGARMAWNEQIRAVRDAKKREDAHEKNSH